MFSTSALRQSKSETALLAAELLEGRIDELPSVNERFYGKPAAPIAMVSTQVLHAHLVNKNSIPAFFVFYGALRKGNASEIKVPVVRADMNNMVWLDNGYRNRIHPRAVLFDGKFTAIKRDDFAPRTQTERRYGVKSADVRSTLDSPLAEWLRALWATYETSEFAVPEACDLEERGHWARSVTTFAIEIFRSIHEFYTLFSEEEEPLVGTFISDGMTKEEVVLAVEGLRN